MGTKNVMLSLSPFGFKVSGPRVQTFRIEKDEYMDAILRVNTI